MGDATARAETSTQPEDLFAGLFAEVFGLEQGRRLVPQHPVADIEGTTRYIDFALRTVAERIASEIDGLTWHVPDPARVRDYEDALLRQNSLIHTRVAGGRAPRRQPCRQRDLRQRRATVPQRVLVEGPGDARVGLRPAECATPLSGRYRPVALPLTLVFVWCCRREPLHSAACPT